MKRLWLALVAVVVFGLGSWAPIPATAKDYTACNGVWVVVDFGSLGGGVSTRCATDYSNGSAVLRNTFGAKFNNGMVTAISGKPGKPDIYKNYWSYWHASRLANGSYSGWSYSTLGAGSYHPTKGNAEGWHYISISETKASAPHAKPPVNPVAVAKPKAPATVRASAASKAASSKPTASTSAASKPTTTASATTKTATTSASRDPSSTPTPSLAVTPAPEGDDPGTPVALIATAATLGVGGLGASAWWLLKGRKR